MKLKFIKPVYAHCDLPCGVYDPVQAKIEAVSILRIMEKYEGLSDTDKVRAVMIKEERAELVKRHLWILWTDYFKAEHLAEHPNLHDLFWRATKQAGACKRTTDVSAAKTLLGLIDEIADIFQQTQK